MKTTYHCCRREGWRERLPQAAVLLALLFGVVPLLLAAAAAYGGTIVRHHDDSILMGPAPGPCANEPADYIGGTDATGHPVAPADVGGGPSVELGSETVYAETESSGHKPGAIVPVEVHGLRAALAAPNGCATHIKNVTRAGTPKRSRH